MAFFLGAGSPAQLDDNLADLTSLLLPGAESLVSTAAGAFLDSRHGQNRVYMTQSALSPKRFIQ
jgi:hypothetical protein